MRGVEVYYVNCFVDLDMRFRRFVPLGSWCRTAHQCRVHSEKFALEETKSTPFDWTITPFRSLSKIIRGDFDKEFLLNPIDSYVNRVGSVTCGYSGLAFHHHLPVKLVESYGGTKNQQVVPHELLKSEEWSKAKRRFLHALCNLMDEREKEGNLYVRWMSTGRGPQIGQFPEVFDGEDPGKTLQLLCSNEWMQRGSSLLYITTEVVEGVRQPLGNPIVSISEIAENCWNVVIKERKGFNGDQLINFKGDEIAWGSLFREIISDS